MQHRLETTISTQTSKNIKQNGNERSTEPAGISKLHTEETSISYVQCAGRFNCKLLRNKLGDKNPKATQKTNNEIANKPTVCRNS